MGAREELPATGGAAEMSCLTHPALCRPGECPDYDGGEKGKGYIGSKQVSKHGKRCQGIDSSVFTGQSRKAGKTEERERGKELGGPLPDACWYRKRVNENSRSPVQEANGANGWFAYEN